MGDNGNPAHGDDANQPGIMIVRPSLHSQTVLNAATFKRWTIMHFRDLLNLVPTTADTEGISRTMRYINDKGELFYTIHTDDITIWQTPAYYAISRRLDLEHTRDVEHGEEAVMPVSADLGLGDEPMVWHLVNAEFGIFISQTVSILSQDRQSYQSVPLPLFSTSGEKPSAPACLLVTLTCTVDPPGDETQASKSMEAIQRGLVEHLSINHSMIGRVYRSYYRHVPSAQPDMHPTIAEGLDGNGQWVVCLMIEGDVDEARGTELKADLEAWKTAWKVHDEDTSKDVLRDVKVGVWWGDLFMQ